MSRWRWVILVLVLASGLGIAVRCMAQDDEFEAVSAGELQKITGHGNPADENVPWWQVLREEFTYTRLWLIGPLILVAAFVFFRGAWRWGMPVLIVSVATLGFWYEGCPCFVGTAVRTIADPLTHRTVLAPFLLLGTVMVTVLLWGRMFCGFVCPLGAAQELLGMIRPKKIRVSFARERILRWGQVVFWAVLVTASVRELRYSFEDIDPFRAVFARHGTVLQWTLLVLLVVAIIFVDRPFCRYLCPAAPLLWLGGAASWFRLGKTATCNNCGACRRKCPVSAISDGNDVDNRSCIRCGNCLQVCKRQGVLLCPVTRSSAREIC